jgi:hypothetical protein
MARTKRIAGPSLPRPINPVYPPRILISNKRINWTLTANGKLRRGNDVYDIPPGYTVADRKG